MFNVYEQLKLKTVITLFNHNLRIKSAVFTELNGNDILG